MNMHFSPAPPPPSSTGNSQGLRLGRATMWPPLLAKQTDVWPNQGVKVAGGGIPAGVLTRLTLSWFPLSPRFDSAHSFINLSCKTKEKKTFEFLNQWIGANSSPDSILCLEGNSGQRHVPNNRDLLLCPLTSKQYSFLLSAYFSYIFFIYWIDLHVWKGGIPPPLCK